MAFDILHYKRGHCGSSDLSRVGIIGIVDLAFPMQCEWCMYKSHPLLFLANEFWNLIKSVGSLVAM